MSRFLLGQVNEMRYRPDIDGLRAVAVLSVVFCHIGLGLFKGGFVGVDVFFVISGYLITRNIAAEVQQGKFSFRSFYLRRARRLFPALFFTLAVTMIVGGVVMVPYHLVDLSKSLVFSIIPLSNIYFWKTSGYFSSEAIVKPLLHIWSLSVEEQFYLFWPGLLILLFSFRSSRVSIMILLVSSLSSLALAEYRVIPFPTAVFFLPQYRIYEFIAGAVCIWLVNHRPKNNLVNELLLGSGLILILYAVVTYSSSTSFPGLNALPPAIGSMLVIYAGGPKFLGHALSNRVAVGIGLISYSLYLVHWPLLVFLNYLSVSKSLIPYIVVIGSPVIATLMYFFVEKPFRRPSPTSITYRAKSFVTLSVTLSILLLLVAFNAWKSFGWVWRYPPELHSLSADIETEMGRRDALLRHLCDSRGWKKCLDFVDAPGIKNIVIMGDSHAVDALNTLYSIDSKPNYIVSELGGCPPLVKEDYGVLPLSPYRLICMERNDDRFSGNILDKADLIVINVLFGTYKPEQLEHAILGIRSRTSAPIWVFGNYIQLKQDLPYLLFTHARAYPDKPVSDIRLNKEWVGSAFKYEDELSSLSQKLSFNFISKKALLCPDGILEHCPVYLADGKLFTYDVHHLSVSATETMANGLRTNYPQLINLIH